MKKQGAVWMQRLLGRFPHTVWLNPLPESAWQHYQSVEMMRSLLGGRMYPLTLQGLDTAIRELTH